MPESEMPESEMPESEMPEFDVAESDMPESEMLESDLREFNSVAELGVAIGLAASQGLAHGFELESDWTYRGSGRGLKGYQAQSRWLITFAVPAGRADGYLMAFAVEGVWNDSHEFVYQESGRCLLLGGPWSQEHNQQRYAEAKLQPWWGQDPSAPGPDVAEIAGWLAVRGPASD